MSAAHKTLMVTAAISCSQPPVQESSTLMVTFLDLFSPKLAQT